MLYLSANQKVQEKYAYGHYSNNKAELAALHMILKVAINNNISQLQVSGDSNMVVDWVNKKIQINVPHLQQLLNDIRRLLEFVTRFKISHIYRELSMEADGMSKQALLLDIGDLETEVITEN